MSLETARDKPDTWRIEDNTERPDSALGPLTLEARKTISPGADAVTARTDTKVTDILTREKGKYPISKILTYLWIELMGAGQFRGCTNSCV
jgi:hypothetical protein